MKIWTKHWLVLTVVTGLVVAASSTLAQSAQLTATVRPNPLTIDLFAPSEVPAGEWFDVSADITNHGTTTIRRSRVILHGPRDVRIQRKQRRLGNLAPGATETISWRIRSFSPSQSILLAEVTGILIGEEISALDTAIVSITE